MIRSSTGYGTGEGLGGWNCRHSFFPFIEGVSTPAYTQQELNELNAHKYEYSGKKLTEYEATQKQRYIERQIRRYKREGMAMRAAGQDSTNSDARLRKWQESQKDFIHQTSLKRDYSREIVNTFDSKQGRLAQKSAENYYQKWSKGVGINNSVETLAKYYDIKYNNSPAYELLERYANGVQKGWISPNASFENYNKLYNRIETEIVGKATANGIVIVGQSEHFMQRILGTTNDPEKGVSRSGVSINDISDALFSPVKVGSPVTRADGRQSMTFVGKRCKVAVNPDTGKLIQTNPRKESK